MECSACQYLTSIRIHTGDWFENGFVNCWKCRRRGNRFIGYTETTSQPKLPQWCPLRKKNLSGGQRSANTRIKQGLKPHAKRTS